MSQYTAQRVITVPADLRAVANAVAFVLDPQPGGAETFHCGLSSTGEAPATHYVCSTLLTAGVAALLDTPDATAMHAALVQMAAARGRSFDLLLGELQDLRDAMDVAPMTLSAFLADRGLDLVQHPDS